MQRKKCPVANVALMPADGITEHQDAGFRHIRWRARLDEVASL